VESEREESFALAFVLGQRFVIAFIVSKSAKAFNLIGGFEPCHSVSPNSLAPSIGVGKLLAIAIFLKSGLLSLVELRLLRCHFPNRA